MVRGQSHGMTAGHATHREEAEERSLTFLIVERVSRFKQRLKQLGKSPVPVGQRCRRLADEHHFKHPRHDRYQPILPLLSRSAAADRSFLQGQSVQNLLHIFGRLVELAGDIDGRATAQWPQHSHHIRFLFAKRVLNECQ